MRWSYQRCHLLKGYMYIWIYRIINIEIIFQGSVWQRSLSPRQVPKECIYTPGTKDSDQEKDTSLKHFPTMLLISYSVQLSSVTQSYPTLCDPMNCSTPGLPVHHQLPEFTQTYVHQVGDTIQPSHPLSSPSPPAPNPSQHQSLFQWVNSSHEVAKVLEFQL